MKDGLVLKEFIERQKNKSKIQIANELGMTRSNLYQMFSSNNLAFDTKKKFEKYFDTEIFPDNPQDNQLGESDPVEYSKQSKLVSESDLISLLQSQIKRLESDHDKLDSHYHKLEEFHKQLQEIHKESVSKILINSQNTLENQKFQIRQLAVISHLQAEYYADGDARKFSEEIKKIDMLVTTGL